MALHPFEALAGFRPAAHTIELLWALAVSDLTLHRLVERPVRCRRPARVVHHLDHRAAARHRHSGERGARRRYPVSRAPAQRISRRKPRPCWSWGSGIPAMPACWLRCCSNRITLGPGEGIFLSAGNLHAYLRGVGLEVMANSDNVLRGGLTPGQARRRSRAAQSPGLHPDHRVPTAGADASGRTGADL